MNKYLLIDCHNYLFQGYYGVPIQAQRRDGTQINAVYGFFSLLRNILKEIEPKFLTIVFDTETGISSKVVSRPEYKSNRPKDHGSVYNQLEIIKKSLDVLNINWIANKELEADDVIGIHSTQSRAIDNNIFIGSNDYDFLQLVSDNLIVVRGYHDKTELFTKNIVINKFGVSPVCYIDYKSLRGDTSDNIKGVPGIGHKRAAELVSTYGTIEQIFKSYSSLDGKYKRLLDSKKEFLLETRDFLKIKTDNKKIKLNIEKNLLINKQLPDKMGAFLDENWECIKSE